MYSTGKNFIKTNNLVIYPNPSVGLYHLEGIEPEEAEIVLITETGKVIFCKVLRNGKSAILDITEMPSGEYFLLDIISGKSYRIVKHT